MYILSVHILIIYSGTGKTTIAELYGKILKQMGYLSNGEVVRKGASELTGQHVGSTAGIVNSLMDSIKGKVLVIDEAYVLGRGGANAYGTEALDTLVERVQGSPGEDFAVILCGYENEMKTMLRTCNPGLSRRFRLEDSFYFRDYTDEQLLEIMLQRASKDGLYLTRELAADAVKNVLSKQRNKPNFGNAGAVANLLNHAKEKMFNRESPIRTKCEGKWVVIASDMYEESDPDEASRLLDGLVNADNIKEHIIALQNRIRVQLKRSGNIDPASFLKNYAFVGSPGIMLAFSYC